MKRVSILLAAAGASLTTLGTSQAKTPGHEYCFHGTCHRVKTLEETRRLIGVTTTMKASFYDSSSRDSYNPSDETSSGERFHAGRPDNAASPVYPDGTKLLVWHPASRKALMIRVNNAGPYWGDRKLDLSRAAADVFGFTGRGVASVNVRVLEAPTKAEATYKRGRTYAPVKGYLGQFASVDAAFNGVAPAVTRLAAATAPQPPAEAKTKRPPVVAAVIAAAVVAPVRAVVADQSATKPSASRSLLDVRLASSAEAEARKFLVVQRTPRKVAAFMR